MSVQDCSFEKMRSEYLFPYSVIISQMVLKSYLLGEEGRWTNSDRPATSCSELMCLCFLSFSLLRQQPHCYNVVTELTVSNEPLLNRAISPLHSVFHLRVLLGHHLAEIPTQGVQSINSFNSYAAHFHSTGHNVCSLGNVPGIFRRFFLLTENFPASRVRSHLLLSATFMVLKLQGNRA